MTNSKNNTGNYNTGDWNTGDYNTGNCNSGDRNTSNCNTGDYNSGDRNTGNYNTGDYNKCSFSSGCFNTASPKIYLFNKPSKWTYQDWLNSEARYLLDHIPKNVLEYILFPDMTEEEKEAHPEAETTGGYLKEVGLKKSAVIWWSELKEEEKNIIMSIPNFDKEIFKEITGIDIDEV